MQWFGSKSEDGVGLVMLFMSIGIQNTVPKQTSCETNSPIAENCKLQHSRIKHRPKIVAQINNNSKNIKEQHDFCTTMFSLRNSLVLLGIP